MIRVDRNIYPSVRSRRFHLMAFLLLAPLFALTLLRFQYPLQQHSLDELWDGLCLSIAAVGVMIRVITVGHLPSAGPKTIVSARSGRRGYYLVNRHPLHVANYLILFSMLLMFREWWLLLAGTVVYLHCVTRRANVDELFLARGQSVSENAVVPGVIARWAGAILSCNWLASLRRESPTMLLVIFGITAIEVAGHSVVTRSFDFEPFWAAFFLGGMVFCAALRIFVRAR
jgi:protein-S-isoprenylcysteine O-methyltransferase Ste14